MRLVIPSLLAACLLVPLVGCERHEKANRPDSSVPTQTDRDRATPPKTTSRASSETLDGTRWTVKLAPDADAMAAGAKAETDTLIFADGKLTSTECVKRGFTPSSYTATKSGNEGWTVDTEQLSASEGRSVWSATISDGNTIHGTVVVTKPDGSVAHFAFDGTKSNG